MKDIYPTSTSFTSDIYPNNIPCTGSNPDSDHISMVAQDCTARIAALTNANILTPSWYSQPRSSQFEQLESLIGGTKLEEFELTPGLSVFAKHEYQNPSGSHYDRTYLATIKYLETHGLIEPGDELRDISSGSAGISLALIASSLDYRPRITVPPELPPARVEPMRLFGAEVVISEAGYVPSASLHQTTEIKQLMRDGWKRQKNIPEIVQSIVLTKGGQRICYLNHSENMLSPRAFAAIGQEFIDQSPMPLDTVCLAIGNWTTIAGIAPLLRNAWPKTKIIGYQDTRTVHDSYGINVPSVPLRFNDPELIDAIIEIGPDERDAKAAKVNNQRSLSEQIGRSSLMGLCAAKRVWQMYGDQNVGTIFYDQKLRY